MRDSPGNPTQHEDGLILIRNEVRLEVDKLFD